MTTPPRALVLADYAGLMRLMDGLDAIHREALPDIYRAPEGPPRPLTSWQRQLADPTHRFEGMDVDGELAAYIHARVVDVEPIEVKVGRRYVQIENVYVDPKCRRHGLARALTASIRRWAILQGAGGLQLMVYAFNDEARRYYASEGFETLSLGLWQSLEGDDPS